MGVRSGGHLPPWIFKNEKIWCIKSNNTSKKPIFIDLKWLFINKNYFYRPPSLLTVTLPKNLSHFNRQIYNNIALLPAWIFFCGRPCSLCYSAGSWNYVELGYVYLNISWRAQSCHKKFIIWHQNEDILNFNGTRHTVSTLIERFSWYYWC